MSSQDDDDVIAGVVETLRDQMATKGDIGRLSDKLEVATTSIRGDIEQVQLRLEGCTTNFSLSSFSASAQRGLSAGQRQA